MWPKDRNSNETFAVNFLSGGHKEIEMTFSGDHLIREAEQQHVANLERKLEMRTETLRQLIQSDTHF